MAGVDWKKWQEDQDKRGGPNARNLSPHYPKPPKKKKKVFMAQGLKPEPSSDFPDTVDD